MPTRQTIGFMVFQLCSFLLTRLSQPVSKRRLKTDTRERTRVKENVEYGSNLKNAIQSYKVIWRFFV